MKVQIYAVAFIALLSFAYAVELECPQNEDETQDVTLLANPEDCTTFFTCSNGSPVLTQCPEGLGWNAEDRVCDWAVNVGCDIPEKVPDKQ